MSGLPITVFAMFATLTAVINSLRNWVIRRDISLLLILEFATYVYLRIVLRFLLVIVAYVAILIQSTLVSATYVRLTAAVSNI